MRVRVQYAYPKHKQEGAIMIQKITTEKIKVANSGAGMNEALTMTEKAASLFNLSDKNRLRARLLAEELLSMTRSIAGEFSADYWIDLEEDTRQFTLHLEAQTQLDYSKRRELLSVSTTGKNTANLGIMDKIRGIFEAGLYNIEESFNLQAEYGTGMFSYGALGALDDGMSEAVYAWSMQKYKQGVEAEKDEVPDAWDELEKSIIANIADDVSVGVLRDKVTLTVSKKF